MKKFACICMAAVLSASVLVGCSANSVPDTNSTSESDSTNVSGVTAGKVIVNFEGTVTAVNGNEITLENGKTIVISSDTVFAGDPDTNNAVSENIDVGNFVQGFTNDDPESDQISADKIWCNVAAQPSMGKLMTNFAGTVAAVDGKSVTLESGEVILMDNDTVFSVASGIVENVILTEGYSIQGYAENPETAASHIHIIAY